MITTVPLRYAGAGRRVYPGFLQLRRVRGHEPGAPLSRTSSSSTTWPSGTTYEADATIEAFYDEYFAVLDMPAEFYLETIDRVFQRALLARGELDVAGAGGSSPGPSAAPALLTVEGEQDDVCGVGQTMAAQDAVLGRFRPAQTSPPSASRRRPLRGVQR